MSLLKSSNYPNHMTEKDCYYSWQDFYQIEKESTYALSEKVLAILAKLSEDVGIPAGALSGENSGNHSNAYRQSSGGGGAGGNPRSNGNCSVGNGGGNRNMRSKGNGGNGGGNKSGGAYSNHRLASGGDVEDNWENLSGGNTGGKIDKKVEKAEGVEKTIQDIRICLNKMTDKNYTKQRDEIRQKMKYLSEVSDEMVQEVQEGAIEKGGEYKKVAKIVFDIASTNKFFSKIYAQLYLELIEEFSIFQELLDVFLEGFIAKLQTIQYIDPETDYDGYCLYTKQQDERKAMSGFSVHLAVGYLTIGSKSLWMVEKLEKIVVELIDRVVDLIDKEGNTNEVEEITEILFLFFSLGERKLSEEWKLRELWGSISEKLLYLSKRKIKEHKSFSSRALFKFLDIQKIVG